MGNEEYEKQKEYERMNQQAQCNMAGGALGSTFGLSQEGRESVRSRVERKTREAVRAGRQAQQLAELGALLDKNPEVARILDLFEELLG